MEHENASSAPESGLPADDDFDDSMGEGESLDDLSFTDEEIADATGASPAPAAPAPSPAPAAAPASQTPSAPAPGEAKPATGAAAPAAAAPTEGAPSGPRPFTVRADRAAHAFEGAEEREDGLFVPKGATLDRVKNLIAAGIAHHGSFQKTLQAQHERATRAEQALDAERNRLNDEVIRAKAQNQFWAELYEKGPDAIAEHLDEFGKTKDLIAARMERAAAKAEREALERLRAGGTAPAPASAPAADEQGRMEFDDTVLRTELAPLVEDLVATVPELAVLTEADRKELIEYLGSESMLPHVYFVAGQDIPEANVFRGDVVADRDVLVREANRIARIRRESAEASAAAARNGGRFRATGAPPSPNGGGAARAQDEGGTPKKRTFKSKAEFDQYFNETPTEQLIADVGRRRSS